MTRPTALGSLLLAIALLTMLAQPVSSQSRPSNRNGLRLKLVGHFDVPTFIAGVGQDPRRIVVVERRGTIRMVRDGRPLRRAFLDIRPRVSSGGERGLLSIAFPPDYALTGRFYVYYTARSGALTIDEYRRSAGDIERADPRTRRLVMAVPHPNRNHNSGQLQFGPDGYMYAGTGDGGRSGDRDGHAQDPRTRLGKILRFDPSGTRPRQRSSPPDNPFIGRPEVPPEIWAKGFRNPWRFSFDQLRGDLVIADVGQNEVEEIDFLPRGTGGGQNFGWNQCEGSQAFPPSGRPRRGCSLPGSIQPVLEHSHAAGYCSLIGGVVVRDRSLVGLYGRYIYGDLCRLQLRTAVLSADQARDDLATGLRLEQVISFGQDVNGCVYVGELGGRVNRIAPAAPGPACPPGKAGPISNPPADRVPPHVRVDARASSTALRSGYISLRVRCDEPCRIQASAALSKGKGKRVLARVRALSVRPAGGESRRLRIALGSSKRALGKRDKAFARLRVRALDGARNVVVVGRDVRLVR